MPHTYTTDGAEIYARSFAMIRAESDLDRFDADEEPIAVRMIHAAGMVELAASIHFSPGFAVAAREAVADQRKIQTITDTRASLQGRLVLLEGRAQKLAPLAERRTQC